MVQIEWMAPGDAALDRVDAAVAVAQGDDPFAALTLVTPTPAAAISLRRALAARRPIAGVGFVSIEDLASRVALDAGATAPRSGEVLVAAVRQRLVADPDAFGPTAQHRATHEAVARRIEELEYAAADPAVVAGADGVAGAVGRIWQALRRDLGAFGAGGWCRLAADALRGRVPGVAAVNGPVIIAAPDAPRRAEVRFLHALGEHVPILVLPVRTGDPAADATTASAWADLGALADPAGVEFPSEGPVIADVVLSANDVDDEVRAVVRRLLARAAEGVPWDRMAIVHPSGAPYARAVRDVVVAAGIPLSGPRVESLGDSMPGRLIRAVFAVADSDLARGALVDLWSLGVAAADGTALAWTRFDHRTRRMGVVAGRAQWDRALGRARRAAAARLAELDGFDAPGDDVVVAEERERRLRRVDEIDAIERAVEVAAAAAAGVPESWAGLVSWFDRLLDGLVGSAAGSIRQRWPDAEVAATDAIARSLAQAAPLDEVDPTSFDRWWRAVVEAVLARPAPRADTTGVGVQVCSLNDAPRFGVDTVAVVGMAEGHLPRRPPLDPLFPDDLRLAVGLGERGAIATDRVALLRTLAGASHRIVSIARHDQRTGRAHTPSRWFIDLIEAGGAPRPDVADVVAGVPVAGVHTIASHHAGLLEVLTGSVPALHVDEWRLSAQLGELGPTDDEDTFDPVVSRALGVVRDRHASEFTRFDGNVIPDPTQADGPAHDLDGDRPLSPTSLETYARCPRQWFFRNALHLEDVERPEAIERVSAADRGTLVHAVLERTVAEAMATGTVPPPGTRWRDEQRERAREITEELCRDLEADGRTGHPRWWAFDQAVIHDVVQAALDSDEHLRAGLGVMPVAVEFTFGRRGEPPLVLDLPGGGQLRLAGQADRVDVGTDQHGRRFVQVWDYKFAKPGGYRTVGADGTDPLANGTRLQLCTYGLAAADHYGVDVVAAHYWLLHPDAPGAIAGYVVDDETRARFLATIQVLTDGIASGRYPARPGEPDYLSGSFEHCRYCDFTRICSAERDQEWQRVRLTPSLAQLRGLIEDGSDTLVAPTPAEEGT